MTISIFGTNEQIDSLNKLISSLNLDLEIANYSIDSIEGNYPNLKKSNLILIAYQKEYINSSWFAYICGFLSSSNVNAIFYSSATTSDELPSWCENKVALVDDERILLMKVKLCSEVSQIFASQNEAKKKLFSMGYLVNVPELCEALAIEDLEIVQLFMAAGFSPSAKTRTGVPLLAHCLRKNAMVSFNYLLEIGADIYAISGDRDFNLIIEAAATSNIEALDICLAKGVDVDQISKDGQSALVLASGSGSVEVCKKLIEAGASKTVVDKMGMSASDYAHLFGNNEICALLGE